MRTIEQLKTDLQMARNSHGQDMNRMQQDLDMSRDEVNITKNELKETQVQVLEQKASIAALNEELDRLQRIQSDTAQEVKFGSLTKSLTSLKSNFR
jgi:predicted  nucleic acid-binding Zn-ribbon protein